MATPSIVLRQVDDALVATARTLFREYAATIGVDLEYQGFSAGLPAPYLPPQGALFIAFVDDAVAGCAALRRHDARSGEMKRLYVRDARRGLGLGARLVGAIVDAARTAGYAELRLDTLASMNAAQALYRRLGFVETPPYGDAHISGTRFYALDLTPRP
ncbi:GNAT superfamily N-acetyltransferase [Dokdonella fugitiva]|uniref:GNAT superfamily N-acetyltransferase n=1 Tax=Dokdonella fugitiva TaxID=328517 RepID=A0A839FBL0_9GAMM|nr:GNAT family N-acetyltransferase [Dokdonella fugitiva]MBA8889474.1 GNAT superfamily N-acetyltransferase [Dokdonella fugitiva]